MHLCGVLNTYTASDKLTTGFPNDLNEPSKTQPSIDNFACYLFIAIIAK